MSERGTLATDGPTACPFVAFEDDRDVRARAPDRRHRCYAETVPAPRAMAHQEHYCLSPAFPACPTFLDWARREAARPGRPARVPDASREASPADAIDDDEPADWRPARRPSGDRAAGTDGGADGEGRRTPRPPSRAVPRLRDEPRDSGLWGSDEVEATRHRDWAAPPPWLAVRGGEPDDEAEADDHGRPEAGDRSEDARAGRGPDREPAAARSARPGDDEGGARDWLPAGAREAPGDAGGSRPPADVPRLRGAPAGELARQLDSVAMPGDLSRARERRGSRQDAGETPRLRRSADDGGLRGGPGVRAEGAGAARPEPGAGRPEAPVRSSRPIARSPAGPAVAQARPALGGRMPRDPAAPAWERPRRLEAYPSLRTRVGLPDVPRLAIYALALVAAAVVLLLAPTFLSNVSAPGPSSTPRASGSPRASSAPRTPAAPTPLVYTVVEGDTLSGIATHFGLTMDQLVEANPQIKNPDRLAIGDELTIPARRPSTPVPVGPGASPSAGESGGAAP